MSPPGELTQQLVKQKFAWICKILDLNAVNCWTANFSLFENISIHILIPIFKLCTNQKNGELCTLEADPKGRLEFRIESTLLKVWDIIGRSLVIHHHNNDKDERYEVPITEAPLLQISLNFVANFCSIWNLFKGTVHSHIILLKCVKLIKVTGNQPVIITNWHHRYKEIVQITGGLPSRLPRLYGREVKCHTHTL